MQLSPVELGGTSDQHGQMSEKWKKQWWNLFERKDGNVRGQLMCTVGVMALEVLHAENQHWMEKESICHSPEPTHPGSGAT